MTKKRSFLEILADPFGRVSSNKPTEQEAKRSADLAKLGAFLDGTPEFMTKNIEETIRKIKGNFGSAIECENTFFRLSKRLAPYKNMFQLLKSENIIIAYHTYSEGTDIVDPSKFTSEEIASLSDKFNAIHDVAMAYNVEVRFGGFDNLPRYGTYVDGSFQGGRGVVVSFRTMSCYPIASNPEFGARNDMKCAEFDEKLNTRFKQEMAPTPIA
jgi:hypothetical protein